MSINEDSLEARLLDIIIFSGERKYLFAHLWKMEMFLYILIFIYLDKYEDNH